jgi:Tumour-associated protein
MIEMLMLMKALTAFFILVYIHVTFSQTPATCLDHVKADWPRDGILRVEILKDGGVKPAPTQSDEDLDIINLKKTLKG